MQNIWQPLAPMEGDTRGHYGVHAFKTHDLALEYGSENRFYGYMWHIPAPAGFELILGAVSLWGEIVEHERGYRASFARVSFLDNFIKPSSDNPVDIEQLRLKYHV